MGFSHLVHAPREGNPSVVQDLSEAFLPPGHLPIGQGVIDFPSILRALVESGYQETITLEVPHDHLESSVTQLKRIINSLKE